MFASLKPVVYACAALAVAGLFHAPAHAQPLNQQATSLVEAANAGPVDIGVKMIDVRTGDVLLDLDADRRFIPASNMKLLTIGAALKSLGDEFVFRTELRRHGGLLIIEGSGDPALGDPALLDEAGAGIEAFLDRLAAAATKTNEPVTEIILDTTVFDDEFVHPDWPTDQLHRRYCAGVTGLNFHANVARVFVRGADSAGARARVEVEPFMNWYEIENSTATISRGTPAISVGRDATRPRLSVRGRVPRHRAQSVEVAVRDPALAFGRLLSQRIAKVQRSEPPAVRLRAHGSAPAPRGEVVGVIETPIDITLRRTGYDSSNYYAESLLKRVGYATSGQPGSWSNGAAVIRMHALSVLGPQLARDIVVADGSGMSRRNQVSAGALAEWVARFAEDPELGDAFIESLPTPGFGTLRSRFTSVRPTHEVRAKSGYINGVRTLSGLVIDPIGGRSVAFSILVNDATGNQADRPVNGARVRRLHERLVMLADSWLSDQRSRNQVSSQPASGVGAGQPR